MKQLLILAVAILWWSIALPASVESSRQAYIIEFVTQQLQQQLGRAPETEELVAALNQITTQSYQQGSYDVGVAFAQVAYRLSNQALPVDHPERMDAINNFAALLHAKGYLEEAERLLRYALHQVERTLGGDDPSTLISVHNLAALYVALGRYDEAEPLHRRAFEARERVLGEEHPDTLISLNSLATLYQAQGRFADAEPLLLRAMEVGERILGTNHPHTLISINDLGVFYEAQGRFGEAESLFVRALEGSRQVRGEDHPDTLVVQNNLASLYASQGRFTAAEPLYQRTLDAREQTLGGDHLDTLTSVNDLAALFRATGRYGAAEPLYLRVLEGRRQWLGKDHPDTLTSANNLAILYQAQGRYDEAEPLHQTTLEVRREQLGEAHPDTLLSLNNLAGLYQEQGRLAEAEPLFLSVLQIRERVLGTEHIDTLMSADNLAALYQLQGRFVQAEPLYQRALSGRRLQLGADHPDTLATLNNLAILYRHQQHYAEAEKLLRTVVDSEGDLKLTHPYLWSARLSLAVTLLNRDRPEALEQLKQVDRDLRIYVQQQLGETLAERVRRQLLVRVADLQDLALTLALEHPSADLRAFAFELMLRWKRLASEEEAWVTQFIRSTQKPEIIELTKQLREARSALAWHINQPSSSFEATAVEQARQQIERLEVVLAAKSRAFRQSQQLIDWRALQRQLPAGSVLVELRRFNPVELKSGSLSPLRWAALLLPADAAGPEAIEAIDLGPIGESESESLAPGLYSIGDSLRGRPGRRVPPSGMEKRLGLLAQRLNRFESVFISPDGPLELFPIHQLRLEQNRYWAQREVNGKPQRLRMLRSGRDLLPDLLGSEARGRGMVAFGGIYYPDYASVKEDVELGDKLPSPPGEFKSLTYSGGEIQEISSIVDEEAPDPVIVTGTAASEAALKSLAQPPRILHLATHGFFFEERQGRTERPLTLSGVALAGANRGMEGKLSPEGEDGILYALEAQGLNLEGTELVTLSACDTGQGEVDYSEGVYGLVRAFQIAGAKNVLISLRKVDDRMAKEFMVDFYRNWFEDPTQHPALALHTTRLAWINSDNPARRDPANWAPWVLWERR